MKEESPVAPEADYSKVTQRDLVRTIPFIRRLRRTAIRRRIPTIWIVKAARLRGKAPLAVAIAVLFASGLKQSYTFVLTTAICELFGIDRRAKYKGLAQLESAKLIHVVRRPKKNPVVTFLHKSGET